MKKTNLLKENIKKMRKTSSKMPVSLYEAIQYEDEMFEDEEPEEPKEEDFDMDDEDMDSEQEAPTGNASQKAAALIDSIRKQALKAMAELADTPDDENYLMLKKVWQMTDRKPEKEEKQGL